MARPGHEDRLEEYQAVASLGAVSAAEIHEWMALAASVFAVAGALLLWSPSVKGWITAPVD